MDVLKSRMGVVKWCLHTLLLTRGLPWFAITLQGALEAVVKVAGNPSSKAPQVAGAALVTQILVVTSVFVEKRGTGVAALVKVHSMAKMFLIAEARGRTSDATVHVQMSRKALLLMMVPINYHHYWQVAQQRVTRLGIPVSQLQLLKPPNRSLMICGKIEPELLMDNQHLNISAKGQVIGWP
ncbi:hypothetical protein HPB52_011879 [Rhipicephalus sanguineus]|uniref:Uncharacterized protein n=1 Tax=Rhipicephalus sanguineus TaxID=34632 RepID=A0A9D4QAP1_RHISA|nr:hypothetical protein HPB52_011879 [Rhipicephalus sanguineus]